MLNNSEFFTTPISRAIWEDRYALKDADGIPIEKSVFEMFERVAAFVSSTEKDPKKWHDAFYQILSNKQFCPAGRILAHAGTHYAQLLNCFVIPFKDDSLEEIMQTASNVAQVQKRGGGTGLNYSPLRPAGSYIKGVNGRSCGVPGFLSMMSVVSEVIEQGGCLTYDTLVNTSNGMFYLGELVGEPKDQGWYDHSLVVKTKDGDQKSERYYVNGYTDVVCIETNCGVPLKGTPNHKIYVMTDSGPIWKEFKDLKKGDWVIVTLGQHAGTVQALETNIPKRHHNCIVPDRLPATLDKSFAYFLGYYVGNGFTTVNEHDHRVGVTIPDKSHLNSRIESIFKGFFGDNIGVTTIKKEDDCSTTYYVSNRMIKEYLATNGLLKAGSLDASIPLKVRQSPSDVVASFLAGLFEADGALRHNYPMLSTSSTKLAHEVQTLLFGLGIPSKIEQVARPSSAYSTNPLYTVAIVSPKGIETWANLIPVDTESRFTACVPQEHSDVNQRWYTLPYGSYWLKNALEVLPKYKQGSGLGALRKELLRLVKDERSLTLSSFNRLRSKISKCCPELPIIYPEVGSQFFLKISDIDWQEDFTADIEVQKSHSYLANGIVSHNSRRGANLGLLEVWHPDVWEFISYKTDHNWDRLLECMNVKDAAKWEEFKFENLYKWQMYNVSVGVSDEFLTAVNNDEEWLYHWKDTEWQLYTVEFTKNYPDGKSNSIKFEVMADSEPTALWKVKKKVPYPTARDTFKITSKRRVKARELWDRICQNAWADGCPGIINLSTIRRMHNLEYARPILASNPCGEQPLPGNSSCNLGSLILSSFVKSGFICYDELEKAVRMAVRFLDNVIDNCEYPLPEIRDAEFSERRIGIGTMGVHDMLIELKLGYDTQEGRDVVEKVLEKIRNVAYDESINLAIEKGSFPLFDRDKYMQSGFIKTLPIQIQERIKKYGIRNSCILSQAPTGTIGAMYGVSTGCEPWFALSFQRNSRLGSYEDGCQAYLKWKQENPGDARDGIKPPYFSTAQDISPEDHIKMMILFTRYCDSAVSKTINLPNSATVGDIKKAFMYAMSNGVKGLTVFRDGCKEAVLVSNDKPKEELIQEAHELDEITAEDVQSHFKKRGGRTVGATSRIHLEGHNMYVTVNKNTDGDLVEVFATVGESKTPNTRHTSGIEDSWAEGLGKMISLALRAGVNPESIIRNLKNIPSDKPFFTTVGSCENSELIPSPPHAIGRVMEEELKYNTNIQKKIETEIPNNATCESCGSTHTKSKSPTCYECLDCGHSRCG